MTCSDQQNKFVRADHIVEGPGFDLGDTNYTGQTVSMVKDVTYFVDDQFVSGVFDSCKNVQIPGLGTIMYMLCLPWGVEYCSPHRWFDFLGSVDNGYAPFQITYQYSEDHKPIPDDKEYHNPDILPCTELAPGYTSGCGCANCPDACKQDPPVFEAEWSIKDFEIAGYDGLMLVMATVFTVGTVLFVGFSIVWPGPTIPHTTKSMIGPKSQTNCLNKIIENFFNWWGRLAARHPIKVLSVSLIIAFSLCFGVIKLEVTTDPIELWASPTSRSRVEEIH